MHAAAAGGGQHGRGGDGVRAGRAHGRQAAPVAGTLTQQSLYSSAFLLLCMLLIILCDLSCGFSVRICAYEQETSVESVNENAGPLREGDYLKCVIVYEPC